MIQYTTSLIKLKTPFVYLGDILIPFVVISVAKMDGDGERGGGDREPGDKVFPSSA